MRCLSRLSYRIRIITSVCSLREQSAKHLPYLYSDAYSARLSELAHAPQPAAVHVQCLNANGTDSAEVAEQAGFAGGVQSGKQWPGEQDTYKRCRRPEVVAGEQTSGLLGVTLGHVDEDALHDNKERGAVHGDARRGRRPNEQEQGEGGIEGGSQWGIQTGVGHGEPPQALICAFI